MFISSSRLRLYLGMKYFYFLLLSVVIMSCNHTKQKPAAYVDLSELKQRRNWIEKYSLGHKNEMAVFAKVAGKTELVKVFDDKWPDDTEYGYNILKDEFGKIIMIYSSPVSESGDWNVEHTHYFDKNENTFLFERKANAFSDCLTDEGVAYETVKKYFDGKFKLMKKTDSLVDKGGKALVKSKCAVKFAIEDATVYPNAGACLKAYHIIL